jgi:BASS family bile acid:Na+ symporter
MNAVVPEWLLSLLAVATLFTVMSSVGLGIRLGDFRIVGQRPALLARGLVATLVVVPILAIGVARALALPRLEEIGLVLMAIAPGAPLALRNALGAGGHRGFAPGLQVAVAVLAVVSVPLSIAVLDRVYAGAASITPWAVAKQVSVAQLLPLGLGIAVRRVRPGLATSLEPMLARTGNVLLALLVVAAGIEIWGGVLGSGRRFAAAVAATTLGTLAIGHGLGGPDATTRTAVATTAATRNAGLALLIATLNAAQPAIRAAVLAYVACSLPIVLSYLAWRRVRARSSAAARAAARNDPNVEGDPRWQRPAR